MRKIAFILIMLCGCTSLFGQTGASSYAVSSDPKRPIIIRVIDLDKSQAYYEKVFGAKSRSIPQDLAQVRRFLKLADNTDIILKIGRVSYNDPDALERPQISVTVPTALLANYLAFLTDEKIKIKELLDPVTGLLGPKRIFINDLDDYVIELLSR